jgi:ribosomal protein S18 acetylase RimI-like enzyme
VAWLGGELIGLTTLVPLGGTAAHYMEYLAVDPGQRSLGVGGLLLRHVRADLAATAPESAGIVLEVEDPDAAAGAERMLRLRRIAFYERNDASLVPCALDYRAPSLTGGEPIRDLLMWLPLLASAPELSGARLRDCVAAILVEGYGLDPGERLVSHVLASLTC